MIRLLNVDSLTFTEFHTLDVPKYVIASHRWLPGAEVMLSDFEEGKETQKSGYQKVKGFAEYIRAQTPDIKWFWIDTCCIDQKSSSEVSEAVNSMFRYYRDAEVCLAYLSDVPTASEDLSIFEKSTWFTRGWTLQELLAPAVVVFLSQDWQVIGHKGKCNHCQSGVSMPAGKFLNSRIAAITQLPEVILQYYEVSNYLGIEEKLGWMSKRQTTREEDLSYGLLGILGVSMNIRYGDGREATRERLLKKLRSRGYTTPSQAQPVGLPEYHTLQPLEPPKAPSPLPNGSQSDAEYVAELASKARDKTEELQVKVIEMRAAKLGLDHPSTIDSMTTLASTYWKQERYEEVEELEEKVVEIQTAKLGADHLDTLSSMAKLAWTYQKQKRLEEAELLEVKVMEARKEKLGPDHVSTLVSMNNIAETYRDQERYTEAEELLLVVIEKRKEKLGVDHKDTLYSMGCLATIYWKSDRLKEAELLEVEVMERRIAKLGINHRSTITSINNLAITYRDQGRLKEAEKLKAKLAKAKAGNTSGGHLKSAFSRFRLSRTRVSAVDSDSDS